MNMGIYWKDAPEWAVAFGHTKDGLPLWIGEKGYAYCYKPNYVYEYGVTGQYREHLVEIITRGQAIDAGEVGQVESTNALDRQQGGNHYKDLKIQPVEFIDANGLDYFQGNVVKYVTRHKAKNGAEDIRKAIHYCQLILQMQYGEQ